MKHCPLFAALLCAPAVMAQSTTDILFILDGSGSMWAPLDQQPKIEIAKNIMSDLILQLPSDISAGLEVYGHRSADDCQDIELLSEPGHADTNTLLQQVQSITPRGKTPLAESLKLAVEALSDSGVETTIVLISDGAENCSGNPCAFIDALNIQASKIRVHVIGFAINAAAEEQLLCIASAGGGQYFNAQNANQLAQAIQQAVLGKTASDARSKPVITLDGATAPASGVLEINNHLSGEVYIFDESTDQEQGYYCAGCPNPIQLPVGRYKLEFPSFVAEGVEIKSAERTLFDLDTIAGRLLIQNHTGGDVTIRPSVADQDREVYLLDQQTGAQQATYCGACSDAVQLPAGRYTLEFPDFIVEGLEIKPGQTTLFDLNAASPR